MEGLRLITSAVAATLVLVPAAFIAYVNAGGSYRAIQHFLGVRKANKRVKTSCSIDADCPPGYVCIKGQCMPSQS
jgi:hypothetical protein